MRKVLGVIMLVAASATLSAAMPSVDNVQISMEAGSVHVNFTLAGGPAFVTAAFLTNGVPLDAELYRDGLKGAVGKLIADGPHRIKWKAYETMTGLSVQGANLTAQLTVWPQSLPPLYMAVDLVTPSNVTYYASAEMVPGGVQDYRNKTDILLMRRIDAAGIRWVMGQPMDGASASDIYSHVVMLTNNYYIGVYEVTQTQYRHIKAIRTTDMRLPIHSNCTDSAIRPMENMPYNHLRTPYSSGGWPAGGHRVNSDCVMSDMRKLSGLEFDLPTEAQWEFACRAGSSSRYTWETEGPVTDSIVSRHAWHMTNWADDPMSVANGNVNQTHAVGQLLPNAFGLYDMLGNVAEFTLDYLANSGNTPPPPREQIDPYNGEEAIEPVGPTTGFNRALRGRHYLNVYTAMRATARTTSGATSTTDASTKGFRPVCPAKAPDWMAR